MGEMVRAAGYSEYVSLKVPGETIDRNGVKEVLKEKYGFTEDNAKIVVADLMLDEEQDGNVRLKAADMTFKVLGSYAPEKTVQQSVNVEGSPQDYVEAEKLRLEYEEKLRKQIEEPESPPELS